MRKISLLFVLLFSTLLIIGCDNSQDEVTIPLLKNPQGEYLTVNENGNSYLITNEEIYSKMKLKYGSYSLLDMIDKDLMMTTKLNNISFWDQVTEQEVETEIENIIFNNNVEERNNLTVEAKSKAFNEFKENKHPEFSSLDDVYEFYHLELAKRKYSRSKLKEKYDEIDFSFSEYDEYFNEYYGKSFYAIILSFDNTKSLKDSLLQLGIQINTNNEWIHSSDSTVLTENEIVQADIDLYNMHNGHKLVNYPEESEILKLNEHYYINNGKIEFDLDEVGFLFYSAADIAKHYNSVKFVLNDGSIYNTRNHYVLDVENNKKVLVLKIKTLNPLLENFRNEIKEKLIDKANTIANIEEEMAILRRSKELIIYDDKLANDFLKSPYDYGFNVSYLTKETINIVAKTLDKTYSADDLFHRMSNKYGVEVGLNMLVSKRLLFNPNINKIYDLNSKSKKDEDKILDQRKWSDIKFAVNEVRMKFDTDEYLHYPSSMGWEKFIEDYYNVENDEELLIHFLYLELKKQISNTFADLTNVSENDELWKFYENTMQKNADKYFQVEGSTLTIGIEDEAGNPIYQDYWSDIQIEYARLLYQDIMDSLLSVDKNYYDNEIKDLVKVFNSSTMFVAGLPHLTSAQPVIEGVNYEYRGIEIAKYKSVGLKLTYLDYGTIYNDATIKPFNDALRSLWKENPTSSVPTLYGLNASGEHKYISTKYGYHMYLNRKSTDIPKWDLDNNKVIPTLNQIKTYIKSPEDSTLTYKMKNALSRYYMSLYNELSSNNYFMKSSIELIDGLDITIHHAEYTRDDISYFIGERIKTYNGMFNSIN